MTVDWFAEFLTILPVLGVAALLFCISIAMFRRL